MFTGVHKCISVGVLKKHPETKQAVTHAEKTKQKTCIWEENNSHLLLREGIILGCQAAKKTYFTNDFIRPREYKEMSSGKKQMTQMLYSDLSSESGHPIHLRDSAWPLVI